MKVLDVTFADVSLESRNIREIQALIETGYDVDVVSAECSRNLPKPLEQVNIHYFHKNVKKRWRMLAAIGSIRAQAAFLRMHGGYDVMICHGYTALLAGYIATCHGKSKPRLVYHAHEFELGRNASVMRSRLKMRLVRLIEKKLCNESALIIVPSKGIAERMKQIYQLPKEPIVVLSTPPYWTIDEKICKEKRVAYEKVLGADKFLVMYHGAVMQGRGIEGIISGISRVQDAALIILGFGNEEYIDTLKALSSQERCSTRVLFQPSVAQTDLWQHIGAVDLETCLIPCDCESYRMAMPNKLFESIQSLKPILASNATDIVRLIRQYDIGMICEKLDPVSIADCIEQLRTQSKLMNRYQQNMDKAKRQLCWEKTKAEFINAFNCICAGGKL